jgi:signal transduction histidine kinase
MMKIVLSLPVSAYLGLGYSLVALVLRLSEPRFGWSLAAVWLAMAAGACAVVEWGERTLRRRGNLEGALLVLMPGPLVAATFAIIARNELHESALLGFSVGWPHAVATLIVLQRTIQPGGRFAEAPLLRRLLRAVLLLGLGGFGAFVLVRWQSAVAGSPVMRDVVLTTWLGVGLAWAVLHDVVDRTPALALITRVRSALGQEPLSRRPELLELRRELVLLGSLSIPLDFPTKLAEAAMNDPELAQAAFDILADVRRTTVRATSPNRTLLWVCIRKQRRLGPPAMATMLRELDSVTELERMLVVKAFLLSPPSEKSRANLEAWMIHVDERLTNELWRHFHYQPVIAAQVINAVTTVRHNIIKHQYANLPSQPRGSTRSRERISNIVPVRLSPENSALAVQIVRQLPPLLRQMGDIAMAEEIAEAERLSTVPDWGREHFLRLDLLIEQVRTIADEMRRLLGVNLADWLASTARLRHDLHPAVPFRLEIDPTLRGSLTLVAPSDWLEQMFGSLLDNAARAALAGAAVRSPMVEVAACLVGDPRAPTIQVAVGDSGAGMPPDERARIWESAGTGLQLALETVHKLNGEARIEDSPLGGLKLVLEMPRDLG